MTTIFQQRKDAHLSTVDRCAIFGLSEDTRLCACARASPPYPPGVRERTRGRGIHGAHRHRDTTYRIMSMENTMKTNVDGDGGMAQMPCNIVLTGEPFFVAVEEEQQADGTRVIVLHSEGLVQLRAVPPAVEGVMVPP